MKTKNDRSVALDAWWRESPPRFRGATWPLVKTRQPASVTGSIESWIDHWTQDKTANLLLFGEPRVGKTYTACAAARRLAGASNVVAHFASAVRLVEDSREDRSVLRDAGRAKILILDDLGAGRTTWTEWTTERVYELIDARHIDLLTTIVTTNHDPGSLREMIGIPTWARLSEDAVSISLTKPRQQPQ